MKITRWLTLRAKPISWVTHIMVMPSLARPTITSSTSAHHFGIERRGGLVEQHDDGVHGQCPCNGYALLLAARELAGELVLVGAVRPTRSSIFRPRALASSRCGPAP